MTNEETNGKPGIAMSAVVALILGVAGILLALTAPAFQPIVVALGAAGIIVGAVAAVNAKREKRSGSFLAWLAVAVGVVAIAMVIWQLAS